MNHEVFLAIAHAVGYGDEVTLYRLSQTCRCAARACKPMLAELKAYHLQVLYVACDEFEMRVFTCADVAREWSTVSQTRGRILVASNLDGLHFAFPITRRDLMRK